MDAAGVISNGVLITRPQAGAALPQATKDKLRDKAEEFESFFIYQFIELTMPKAQNNVLGGGQGEEMFRHNLNEQLAKNIAQGGGFGLADGVYAELLRKQEALVQNQPQ